MQLELIKAIIPEVSRVAIRLAAKAFWSAGTTMSEQRLHRELCDIVGRDEVALLRSKSRLISRARCPMTAWASNGRTPL
jgi:hypothetical protein